MISNSRLITLKSCLMKMSNLLSNAGWKSNVSEVKLRYEKTKTWLQSVFETFLSLLKELEQEKHILKGKLDAKVQLEADYQADIDALQTNANEKIATLKKSFNTKLSTLEETV